MADFIFEADAANEPEANEDAEGGGDDSSRGSHSHLQNTMQPRFTSMIRLISFIPDELIVFSFFILVFAVCLAAMLPWYFAARNLVNASSISTPDITNGLSVLGLIKSLDPLALAASLALEVKFAGCTNVAHYIKSSTSSVDESLDLFYMDASCLNGITGNNWTTINGDLLSPEVHLNAVAGRAASQYKPLEQAQDGDTAVRLRAVKSYQSYPFDSYTAQLVMTSFIAANGTVYNESGAFLVNGTFPTPITFTFQSSVVGFTVNFQIVSATSALANSTSAIIFMEINRSSFSQGLSLFIVIVMWGISLGITVLTLDVTYVRHYKPVSLGMAGLCATMLFALPSLRGVQPGIPPIALYASIDIFSYFMNMALISASLILVLIKIIAENKDPRIIKDQLKREKYLQKHPTGPEIASKPFSNT